MKIDYKKLGLEQKILKEEIINNIDTILTFSIAYALVKFSEDFGIDLTDCIIKD